MQLPPNVLAEMRGRTSNDSSLASQLQSGRGSLNATSGRGSADLSREDVPRYSHQTMQTHNAQVTSPATQVSQTKKIVKEGWIVKQGGARHSFFSRESWKRRWAILEAKRLVWAESPSALPKGEVFIKGAVIELNPPEAKRDKLAIAVRHAERTLFFRLETAAEQQEWHAALTTVAQGEQLALQSVDASSDRGRRESQLGVRLGRMPPPNLSALPAGAVRPTAAALCSNEQLHQPAADSTSWWKDRLTSQAGYLYKQGGSKGGSQSWRRRYAVLQNGELLYYKADRLRGAVQVRGAVIDDRPSELRNRQFSFAIRHPSRTFFGAAESAEDLAVWLGALRQCAISIAPSLTNSKSAPPRMMKDSDDSDDGDDLGIARPGMGAVPATPADVPDVEHVTLNRAVAPKRKPRTRVRAAAESGP